MPTCAINHEPKSIKKEKDGGTVSGCCTRVLTPATSRRREREDGEFRKIGTHDISAEEMSSIRIIYDIGRRTIGGYVRGNGGPTGSEGP